MRILNLQLKNFKRFTDLVVTNIPPESKLVLLVGANGSGKSSVFDAFEYVSRPMKRGNILSDTEYYAKNKSNDFEITINLSNGENIAVSASKHARSQIAKNFYGRSSLRIEPAIQTNGQVSKIPSDDDAPEKYTGFDHRFQQDVYQYIQDIDNSLREPVFKGEQADTVKIFRDFIKPLNDSLLKIFGGNEANVIQLSRFQNADLRTPPKLIFKKGTVEINYDLLSHGEKQVVILLLNFIVRNKYHQDSIYYIDEMDVHLNTALQFNLIKEVVENYIPGSSQLWTASHSLGFINYATSGDNCSIIDFDSFNFDNSINIAPSPENNYDIFEIAVPKDTLAKIIENKRVMLCENKNDKYYNGLNIKDTVFVGVLNSNAVFIYIKRDTTYNGLRDRDFLTTSEIQKLRAIYPHYYILHYYSFENYLYHPDNVEQLGTADFNKTEYHQEILLQKKAKQIAIITDLKKSRDSYEEFKTDGIKDSNIDEITNALMSDNFDEFYTYFNMRDRFDKTKFQKYLSDIKLLSETPWFKGKIESVINQ